MAVDPQALKTELTTDPRSYGYAAALAVSDQAAADLLNVVRDGTNGGPAISVNRGTISSQELVEAVVQSEMPSNANQRDWLIMVASGERVRVDTGSTARAGLLAIFGAPTVTRANLTAVSQQVGSRGEELFGVGTVVTGSDVDAARQLP
jgi:hypothetical protein